MNEPDPKEVVESTNPYAAPIVESVEVDDPAQRGDSTGGLIPYKNPHALIAYYLGIAALFPLVGVPFGIAAIILGISGLRKRRENQTASGTR